MGRKSARRRRVNRAAPDIAYVDSSGDARHLSELKGDVVLINFWATWCAPCRREMPLLARMQREYRPQRFRVLYLSLEEPEVLDGFLKANHFDGIQGRLAAAPPFYDAGKFYPLSYLVYSESFDALPGRVRDYVLGKIHDVLTGKDTSKDFAHLSADDRKAILEILGATKPNLPASWRAGTAVTVASPTSSDCPAVRETT